LYASGIFWSWSVLPMTLAKVVVETKALTLTPGNGTLVPSGCPQGNPGKVCLFVTEKQPTSIAIGWR
jgi:hypothetical protein